MISNINDKISFNTSVESPTKHNGFNSNYKNNCNGFLNENTRIINPYSDRSEIDNEIDSIDNKDDTNTGVVETLKPTLLDEILDNYGYRFHMIRVIFLSVILYYLSSYMIYHVSSYLLILKREFKISDDISSLLGCLAFGCKAIGCIVETQITKFLSRRNLIISSILILLILNIFLAFVFQLWVYFIFIIIGCFIAGILDPLNISVLCESLPIRFRGFFLCFSYTGFSLNNCIQYFLISEFSQENSTDINVILHINSIITLLFFVLLLVFFRDSARHHLIQEKYKEAYETINDFTERPLTEEEKKKIKTQSAKGNKIIHETQLKAIFASIYIRRTIILLILNFSYNFMTDGVSYILNLILDDSIPDSTEQKVSQQGAIIYLFGLFSYVFCGFITEINCIGRKFALNICSAFVCLFSILFIWNQQNYLVWLTLLLINSNATTSLGIAFVSESYPTKIRDISQGFLNSTSNLGSFFGQLIFMKLYNISKTNNLTFLYLVVNSVICIVLVFFIKNEMNKKPLDNLIENAQSDNESVDCKTFEEIKVK